jgi:hypothetical protein
MKTQNEFKIIPCDKPFSGYKKEKKNEDWKTKYIPSWFKIPTTEIIISYTKKVGVNKI